MSEDGMFVVSGYRILTEPNGRTESVLDVDAFQVESVAIDCARLMHKAGQHRHITVRCPMGRNVKWMLRAKS